MILMSSGPVAPGEFAGSFSFCTNQGMPNLIIRHALNVTPDLRDRAGIFHMCLIFPHSFLFHTPLKRSFNKIFNEYTMQIPIMIKLWKTDFRRLFLFKSIIEIESNHNNIPSPRILTMNSRMVLSSIMISVSYFKFANWDFSIGDYLILAILPARPNANFRVCEFWTLVRGILEFPAATTNPYNFQNHISQLPVQPS